MRVERTIQLVRTTGGPIHITLSIGEPVATANGSWQCEVSVGGLGRSFPPAQGVDSMQALLHAVWMLKIQLDFEVRHGAALYWLGEEVTVEQLFGSALRSG